jgi:hypothetical protein
VREVFALELVAGDADALPDRSCVTGIGIVRDLGLAETGCRLPRWLVRRFGLRQQSRVAIERWRRHCASACEDDAGEKRK